jgi:hypothetical protein
MEKHGTLALGGVRSYDSRQRAAEFYESTIVARSFEPIIQRSVGPFSKLAFKAAFVFSLGFIVVPREKFARAHLVGRYRIKRRLQTQPPAYPWLLPTTGYLCNFVRVRATRWKTESLSAFMTSHLFGHGDRSHGEFVSRCRRPHPSSLLAVAGMNNKRNCVYGRRRNTRVALD